MPRPETIDGAYEALGQPTHVELRVARLPTGTWVSIPVAVVRGARPGPAIFLSGAVHGDELVGVAIIRAVLAKLDAKKLRGTVIAVPVVNVFGLIEESRYLPDRRDLNRSFPGSKTGSLAARLAHLFLTEVVDRCEYGLDFHTAGTGRTNLPQIRCDADDPVTLHMADVFHAPVTLQAKLLSGSLRDAAVRRGCRVLLYEAGEPLKIEPTAVRRGVHGTMRILADLDMIDDAPEPDGPSLVATSSSWLRARRAGFVEYSAGLGATVEKGETVAEIFDLLGPKGAVVKARNSGIIIGAATRPFVNQGDALLHVAADPVPNRAR